MDKNLEMMLEYQKLDIQLKRLLDTLEKSDASKKMEQARSEFNSAKKTVLDSEKEAEGVVTAYEQYMKKSFECRPFRFLTKPLNEKELELSFRDAEKYLAKRKRICTLTDKRNTIRLLYDSILYCECNGHWIIIHTKDEEIKLFMSMKELIAYFDNTSIYRVHKSFAVNFKYIQTIKDNRILLNEKRVELPLGRAYKETVYNQYTEYFERSLYI